MYVYIYFTLVLGIVSDIIIISSQVGQTVQTKQEDESVYENF